MRVTYGVDWQLDCPGWRIKATIGQSYRLTDKPTLFPDGTGLTERVLRLRRPDRGALPRLRQASPTATASTRTTSRSAATRSTRRSAATQTYLELGYLRLNRDIDLTFEDLQDREELRAAGRVAFAQILVGVRLGGGQPDRPRGGPELHRRRLQAAAHPARRRLCRRLPRVRLHLAARLREPSPTPSAATASTSISRCATSASGASRDRAGR